MLFGASMSRVLAAIVFFLLAPQFVKAGTHVPSADQQSTDSAAATSPGEPPQKSDREKDGLRGPVEECSVNRVAPPLNQGDRAVTDFYRFKYDRDGNMYQRSDNNGTESITYDARGRKLAEVWDGRSGPEIIYTYDAQGRLVAINGEEGRTTTFEYDDQGRKTQVVKSEVRPSSSSISQIYGGSWDGDLSLSVIPPDGGLVKTSFDERDQPIESLVYDAEGDLVRRLSLTYDAKGRAAEYSVVDTKLNFLPSPETGELVAAPAASEEMESEPVDRISYVYDDQDRVVEKHEHDGFSRQETITKITYNDHGDEIEEFSTTYGDLDHPTESTSDASDSPSGTPESGVMQFGYKYDNVGNWIEQTVSSPTSANEPNITLIAHRTITYY